MFWLRQYVFFVKTSKSREGYNMKLRSLFFLPNKGPFLALPSRNHCWKSPLCSSILFSAITDKIYVHPFIIKGSFAMLFWCCFKNSFGFLKLSSISCTAFHVNSYSPSTFVLKGCLWFRYCWFPIFIPNWWIVIHASLISASSSVKWEYLCPFNFIVSVQRCNRKSVSTSASST